MKAAAEKPGTDTGPRAFPWRETIHAGLFLLRLPPETFWRLTPVEFHAMTGGFVPRFTLPLKALMERYPDVVSTQRGDDP